MLARFKRSLFIRNIIIITLFGLSAGSTWADTLFGVTAQDSPLPVEQAFVFNYHQSDNSISLAWNIANDYYMYKDKMAVAVNGADITDMVVLPEAKLKEDPLFGATTIYTHQVSLMVRLDEVSAGDVMRVSYQGCWEGGVCYPPQFADIELTPAVVGKVTNNTLTLVKANSAAANFQVVTPQASLSDQSTNANWYIYQLSEVGLGALLMTFFVAGLALALTPCVLPMVPILSNIIVGMNPKPGSVKSFSLSLVYVLAMAITYALAGVLAGLTGANLQAALQHPVAIGAMVVLFIFFAAVMFDWLSVQMPSSVQTRLNALNQKQNSGQFLGVALMGVISALVVGPCVAAPLAGALLYIGQTGDPYTGGLALFALGMGMGVPLLAVGTSAGKWIPKAGPWMQRIKFGFGFLMLYMAVWLLDRIFVAATVPLIMVITLVAAFVLWQVHRWQPNVKSITARALAYVSATLMTFYAITLAFSLLMGQPSLIAPLKIASAGQSAELVLNTVKATQVDALLQQAKAENQPVLMYFSADWCVSCREIEAFIYHDAQVQEALQGVVLFKVDVTEVNQISKDILSQYQLVGPPGMVFFDRSGRWLTEQTMVGVPTSQQLAAQLLSIQ